MTKLKVLMLFFLGFMDIFNMFLESFGQVLHVITKSDQKFTS